MTLAPVTHGGSVADEMLAGTFTPLRDRDERSLVEWHQSGHPEAFEEIVRRYTPGLLGDARRRLADQQGAEDAVQETFARAYTGLDRFEGEYRLGGWLHQILVNVCLDECQRRQRQTRLIDRLETVADTTGLDRAEVEIAVIDGDHGQVSDALCQLPAPYREALVMRFVEDRPYDEVAAAAGITEQNARARTSRARRMMRHALGGAAAFLGVLAGLVRRGERAASALTPEAVEVSPVSTQLAPTVTQLAPTFAQLAHSGGAALATSVGVAASAAIAFVTLAPHHTEPRPSAPPPVVADVGDEAPAAANSLDTIFATAPVDTTPTSVVDPSASTSSSVPEAQSPTTTAAPAPVQPTPIATVGTTPPPAPPARVGATLSADDLVVTPAGSRRALSGMLVIATSEGQESASIEGKLLGGSEAGRVEGELVLRLADGRSLTLQLVGQTAADGSMSGRYLLDGADRIGVDPEGAFTGSFSEADGTGALTLALNGGHNPAESPSS